MNRAYSTLEIKSVDTDTRKFTGIASTPSTDRMGDIVEPKGAQFKLPIPLLWQHNSSDPIGWVKSAKVTKDGIEVEGEIASIAEEGSLKERLKTAWQMIQAKLVRGLSIGFNSIESARIDGTYGIRFMKWEWLELSAVTIPANQEATITAVKSADSLYLAASGRTAIGKSSPRSELKREVDMKTVHEQLAELKEMRQTKTARMEEIVDTTKTESRNFNEAEVSEFDVLDSEVKGLDNEIRIKTVESFSATTAKAVSGEPSRYAASGSRGPTILIPSADKDEKFQGQNFTRMVVAKALGHLNGVSPSLIAEARWGKSNPTLVRLVKANEVQGGGTVSGEWGAELATVDGKYTGDFIEFLASMTVYDRLPLRAVPHNVTIKGRDGASTGYWVGEGKAIPATASDFSSVNLTPLKVAALAVISNELLRDSTPSAEMLVRDALAEAVSQRTDVTFLGAVAASAGVSPAGMLNGVAATISAGNDADGVRADIKALYAIFIAAKNASGLSFVMNPAMAKSIQLMTTTLGIPEFPGITQNGGTLLGDPVFTGDNVAAHHVILLKPSDIYKIGDLGLQVSISREATIEMNSVPTGASLVPTAQSVDMVNMFQSDNTAIKIIRPINFAKRRSGAVQFVSDAAYGESS